MFGFLFCPYRAHYLLPIYLIFCSLSCPYFALILSTICPLFNYCFTLYSSPYLYLPFYPALVLPLLSPLFATYLLIILFLILPPICPLLDYYFAPHPALILLFIPPLSGPYFAGYQENNSDMSCALFIHQPCVLSICFFFAPPVHASVCVHLLFWFACPCAL